MTGLDVIWSSHIAIMLWLEHQSNYNFLYKSDWTPRNLVQSYRYNVIIGVPQSGKSLQCQDDYVHALLKARYEILERQFDF